MEKKTWGTKGNLQNKKVKLSTRYVKINSKWTKDQIIRPGTIKHLEKKHSCKVFDLGLGNRFLDMTSKSQVTKDKVDELNFINSFVLQRIPSRK